TGGTDDVLVWNGVDGKLLRYAAGVFNGCPTVAPLASTALADKPALAPGHGSQILTIDSAHVLLQGHEDVAKGNDSFLPVYDSAMLKPVGKPVSIAGMRSAAVLATATAQYAVVGFPNETIDGVTSGVVRVFELDMAMGLRDAPV